MTPNVPMSTQHSLLADLARCNRDLDQRLKKVSRHMNIRRYRAAKMIFAFTIVISSVYGVMEGGDPTLLIGTAILFGSALLGLEVTELLETYQQGVQMQEEDNSDD